MSQEALKYKLALSFIPLIGDINAKKLVAYLGSPEALFKESKKNLLKIPGIGESIVRQILHSRTLKRAAEEIEFIQKHDIKVYFYLDDEYPERLKHCPDGPVVLYTKGDMPSKPAKIISIVGTRHATAEGTENCNRLVNELAANHPELVIVSGLAYGIDACAHLAALDAGINTMAVLGHGMDTIYPSLHKKMAGRILNQGALITDFPGYSSIEGRNFVKRNRIIAGLSDATIVVESGKKGGALTTADIANSYDRDVFAFPGRTTDVYSKGCHHLIKSHKAMLCENGSDIEYLLGWDTQHSTANEHVVQQKLFDDLADDERSVIDVLTSKGEQTVDQICFNLNEPIHKISPLLLNLEFYGKVKCLPGKRYKAMH